MRYKWRGKTENPAPRRCAKTDCRNRQPCPDHPNGWARMHQKAKDDPNYRLPPDWKERCRIIREQANGKCNNCGKLANPGAVDHIIPRARGGNHELDNLQLLCKRCHDRKSRKERLTRGEGSEGERS